MELSDTSKTAIYSGAALLALVPFLYRLGALSSLMVLGLAVALSAVPEVRHIVDSITGRTPSGHGRLSEKPRLHDVLQSRFRPNDTSDGSAKGTERFTGLGFAEDRFVELDVGDVLKPPISKLVSLVQRDFVDYWYNTSIALSPDTPFPKQTTSLLNTIMNNAVARVKRQDPKEVSIYLFHSASTALISELRESKTSSVRDPALEMKEKDALIKKVRRTSEELLLTLAPRSATSSNLVLALLTEIVSLQIWSTIQSMNADWINSTIEAHFGEAVSIVEEVRQEAKAAEAAASMHDQGASNDNGAAEDQESTTHGAGMLSAQTGSDTNVMRGSSSAPPLPPRQHQVEEKDEELGETKQKSASNDVGPAEPTFAASTIPLSMATQSFLPPQSTARQSSEKADRQGSKSTPVSPLMSSAYPVGGAPSTSTAPPRASTSASTPNSPRLRNTVSLPGSPIQSKHVRLASDSTRLPGDSLEEVIDQGAAKLRAFGKSFFEKTSKFLDTALPPDNEIGIANEAGVARVLGHGNRRSLHVSTSGTGGITGAGPSLKGKERARDPVDFDCPEREAGPHSPQRPSSPRPASISSKMSASTRGPSSRPTSLFNFWDDGPSASSAASVRSQGAAHATPESPQSRLPVSHAGRVQRLLDSFKAGGSAETRAGLVKQLEISLSAQDASLLFPEPRDSQLRAVLARHTASAEVVDPQLVELSDEFHAYLEHDQTGSGEKLLRLWTQLDHFDYMVEMTQPTDAQMKEDALALLKKVIGSSLNLHGIVEEGSVDERAYWTAVEMVLLRLAQNPSKEMFEPLQDWILREIESKHWSNFLAAKPHLQGDASYIPPIQIGASVASTSGSAIASTSASAFASTSGTSMTSVPLTKSSSTHSIGGRPMSAVMSPSPSRKSLASLNAREPEDGNMDLGDSMNMSTEDDQPSSVAPTNSAQGAAAIAAAAKESAVSTADAKTGEAVLAPPAFTVSLTDLSPPSAYVNGHVKQRRELEFLIAVEVEGSPGYILARKYTEFEKMDAGIKKALPLSGTKAFPRAPLPSTNFQTSENLCRSLEHYLEALLHDDRYAASEPVALFFAKERTDSKGNNNIQPLAFLGRGVNNLGRGVTEVTKGIGKGGEFATKGLATGFNNFTTAVTTIPGLRRTTSGSNEGGSSIHLSDSSDRRLSSNDIDAAASSPSATASAGRSSLSSHAPTASRVSLTSPSAVSLTSTVSSVREEVPETQEEEPPQFKADATVVSPVETGLSPQPPVLPPRPSSPEGYEVPAALDQPKEDALPVVETPTQDPQGPNFADLKYAVREKPSAMAVKSQSHQSHSPAIVTSPAPATPLNLEPSEDASPVLRGRMSFDELLRQDQELRERRKDAMTETAQATAAEKPDSGGGGIDTPTPTHSADRSGARSPNVPAVSASSLSPTEFNNVLSLAMAILEEAYGLVDNTWNLRRGILKVLETLLRTSYASYIKAAVARLVTTASEEEFFAEQIDTLRKSFWPPPNDIWWSSLPGSQQPERSAEAKEATRREARRLIIMQAPEGLKVSLGNAATAEAFGRLHDAMQGPGAERLMASLLLDYLRLLLL